MLKLGDYIHTIKLINQRGLRQAAVDEKITCNGICKRIKVLEQSIGIKLYPEYNFDRMTYLGREWLKQNDQN